MYCSETPRRPVRHRFTLPMSLLLTTAISSAAAGAEITVGDGDSYVNNSAVVDIYSAGNVATIENRAGGTIGTAPDRAVEVIGNVDKIINAGTIASDGDGVNIGGDVTSFANTAGGSIESLTFSGVYLNGAVGDFTNAGAIKGQGLGVSISGDVTSFLNAGGGSIEGAAGDGLNIFGNVERFTNAGQVFGTSWGAYIGGDVMSFINTASGEITGLQNAVHIIGDTLSFTNDGVIRSSDGTPTLLIEGDVGSFINRGTVAGGGWGVGLGSVDNFFNTGTIAALGPGPRIGVLVAPFGGAGTTNSFVNTGTIEGTETGVRFEGGVTNMVNAGVLRGGVNALDSVGVYDDILTLLTGSTIFGALSFGGGYDTLDFSNFTGNTLLLVGGLEKLVPGSTNYVDARSGGAGGQIAIFDISGLDNRAIGRDLGDVTGAVRTLVSDSLFGEPTSADFNAAPVSDASFWVSAVGGSSIGEDSLDLSSRFGGLVLGSQSSVSDTLTLGGLAGYFGSRSSVLEDQERLENQTGLVGLYGKTALGSVDLDFTLLGGFSGHTSTRQVIANGTETARSTFSSIFVTPSLGVSIPVLSTDVTTLLLRGETSYVAGLTTAYTETGSSMNLAVGEQSIGFFDIRVGLEARQTIEVKGHQSELVAKSGVLGQANLGSSSVPVSTLGQTVDVGTPGSGSYGLYGALGFDAPVNDNFAFNARLNGVVHTDGRAGLTASLGIGGTF